MTMDEQPPLAPPPPPGIPAAPPPPPPGWPAAGGPAVPPPLSPVTPGVPHPVADHAGGAGGRGGGSRKGIALVALAALGVLVVAVLAQVLVLRGGGPGTGSKPSPSPVAQASATPAQTGVPSVSPSASAGPTAAPAGPTTIRIGISLPLTGSAQYATTPARDGALMAIEAFELDGYRIETVVLDHTVGDVHDPQQGAADMTALVQDPEVVAVVGPFNSSVAKAQVPVSNEAGLLQCSPANTNPDVTKGAPGLELRATYPDRISYIRVSTTDDFQGDAVAEFAFNTLGLRRVAIIDDGETYGHGTAVAFAAAWERLGGVVVGSETIRAGSPGHAKALKGMAAATPDAVFFGGLTSTGGVETRLGMVATGLGDLPLLSVDGIQDGPASAEGSFINLAGDAAANTYSSVAAIGEIPGQADFQAAYMKRYGTRPGAYSAPAHACAEVILAAIRAAADRGEVTREAVRAAATDTAATFDTVIGPVRFDAVGDITTKTVSIYRVDTGSDGVADWFYQAQVAIEPR